MVKENTTIHLKKETWTNLARKKLDSEATSYDELINSMLQDKERR